LDCRNNPNPKCARKDCSHIGQHTMSMEIPLGQYLADKTTGKRHKNVWMCIWCGPKTINTFTKIQALQENRKVKKSELLPVPVKIGCHHCKPGSFCEHGLPL
jgi:hypothetical protein